MITRAVIALSSGEAEYYGIVKAGSNALGLKGMLADVSVDVQITVCTDSSAAKGIASRRGLGKVRHMEAQTMWIQQRIRNNDLDLYKVPGENNPADILTKADIPRERMEKLHFPYRIAGVGFPPLLQWW